MLNTEPLKIRVTHPTYYSSILNALMVNDICFMFVPDKGVLNLFYQVDEYEIEEHKYKNVSEQIIKDIFDFEKVDNDMYEIVT